MERYELVLAERLGMTRARLRREMRTDELVDWIARDALDAADHEHEMAKAQQGIKGVRRR